MFPKHYYNFRIFCVELNNFCTINKQSLVPLECKLKENLLFSVKLTELFFLQFSTNLVPSNPCVGPSPRIRIYQHVQKNLYLLQKLYNFYKIHCLLKTFLFYQIQYHIHRLFILINIKFLAKLNAPNKQFSNVE